MSIMLNLLLLLLNILRGLDFLTHFTWTSALRSGTHVLEFRRTSLGQARCAVLHTCWSFDALHLDKHAAQWYTRAGVSTHFTWTSALRSGTHVLEFWRTSLGQARCAVVHTCWSFDALHLDKRAAQWYTRAGVSTHFTWTSALRSCTHVLEFWRALLGQARCAVVHTYWNFDALYLDKRAAQWYTRAGVFAADNNVPVNGTYRWLLW